MKKSDAVMTTMTPMGMLEKAVTSGADVAVLEKLMGLSERWQANQARAAFSDALAALRDDLPRICKTQSADFGTGKAKYKYEDLADVVSQLSQPLSKHGLSFRWRTDSTETGLVSVTCILSHRDGHDEETTLAGPIDSSGNKNAIQAIGSVVTYLQRYTLKASIGIAAADDDDGHQAGPPPAARSHVAGAKAEWEQAEAEIYSIASRKYIDLIGQAINKGLATGGIEPAEEWLARKPDLDAVSNQVEHWEDLIGKHEAKVAEKAEKAEKAPEVSDDPPELPVDPNQTDIEGYTLEQICGQLQLLEPEDAVGPDFKDRLVKAGEMAKVQMAYPLVKLRGLATEFDSEKFRMKANPFPYEQVPVHIAMAIVDYVADKAGVSLVVI